MDCEDLINEIKFKCEWKIGYKARANIVVEGFPATRTSLLLPTPLTTVILLLQHAIFQPR